MMVEVQAEEAVLLRDGQELDAVKSGKKKGRNRKKPVASAAALQTKSSGRQLSSHGSSDDIEVDSAISSAASEVKAPSAFPAGNVMVNDQLAYGLALVMGLEATVRTLNGAGFCGLIHSFGPGEVVLCEVTVTPPENEASEDGKDERETMETDYVCISLHDVVDLVVESVPDDGAIDVLDGTFTAPADEQPKKAQKVKDATLKGEAKGKESVDAKAVVEEKSEEKAKEKTVVSSRASRLDCLMDGQEEAQVSPFSAKPLHQESHNSTTKERYGEERQDSLPFNHHNGRSLPGGNAPPAERYPPPRHSAPTRMPFIHNDRSRHYGPGPNYRPSVRPNRSSHNHWKQRPANTYPKAAAHPGPAAAAKAAEKPGQPATEVVTPTAKTATQADGPTEGGSGRLQEAIATATATAAQEVEEVAWRAEAQKAEETVVVGNPWSSTSNVWHRRHVPSSPQALPAATASDPVSLPEDGDNQRFVDSFRQAATTLNPEADEFVPRVGSRMEEESVMAQSPNVHGALFSPMSPPARAAIFPFQPAPPGMLPAMPLSPTAGAWLPMEAFQQQAAQGLPPHVLPVPNMFVPLDVQAFINGPGGFPAAPFFHSIAPNGEAQGIYMPILPPLESYYASLLFHQMQAHLQHAQQQQQQVPHSPPQQASQRQEGAEVDGEGERRPPSCPSSGLTSPSSNQTLSQMSSPLSFAQVPSTTSDLSSS